MLEGLPGTGGLRRGTGEDDMAGLFCLSPGKNNSFGSAKVARSATVELDTMKGGIIEGQAGLEMSKSELVTWAVGPDYQAEEKQGCRRDKKYTKSRKRKDDKR